MDPVSLIGILGSIVSIGDVVGRSIQRLTELRHSYRNAPMLTVTLIGQLHIIRGALDQLSAIWDSDTFKRNPRYHQLAVQMSSALESFGPLMLSLEAKLQDLNCGENVMTTRDKLTFLWNEREMGDYFTLVDRQVNALNLLLHAIQCSTWAEQQRVINDDDNQVVMQLARDCTSSILGLSDRRSIVTEDTNAISVEFDFDTLILGSQPYLSAYRSNLRQAIRPEIESAIRSAYPNLRSDPPSDDVLVSQTNGLIAPSISPVTITDPGTIMQYPKTIDRDGRGSLVKPRSDFVAKFVGAIIEVIKMLPKIPVMELDQRSTSSTLPRGKVGSNGFFSIRRPQSQPDGDSQRSRSIEDQRRLDRLYRQREVRVLLLGTSESGKSTLMKGFKHLANINPTLDEKVAFKEIIFTNLVLGCRVVLEAMEKLELSLGDPQNEYHTKTILMQPLQMDAEHLPPEVATAIKVLWTDEGFRTCYRRRHEYQVPDSFEYYVNSVERLAQTDYIPSAEDILRGRYKTSGVWETKILRCGVELHLFDVGGARSERKKWIHCFEHAKLIIFTVDATVYGRVLVENEKTNRMQEQLTLFDGIINSRWFMSAKFILVFTKMDLLEQRLSEDHPTKYFPDLKPGIEERSPTVDEYITYMEWRFLKLVPKHQRKIRVVYANLVDMKMYDGPAVQKIWACGDDPDGYWTQSPRYTRRVSRWTKQSEALDQASAATPSEVVVLARGSSQLVKRGANWTLRHT